MRIVGGSLGGRVLRAPPGAATRPTSEKVRQAIFNILPDADGAHVLDVFAGSGALGIEALSRGAAHATFFDTAKPALAAVKAWPGNSATCRSRATTASLDRSRARWRPSSCGRDEETAQSNKETE